MMTVAQILEEESAVWSELSGRLDALPEDAWTKPGVNGAWTPKDLLAHVSVWHVEGERMLSEMLQGRPAPWTNPDEFNARAYEEWRAATLERVRATATAARASFLEVAARLEDPVSDLPADAFVRNAQQHYRDHFDDLDRFAKEVS